MGITNEKCFCHTNHCDAILYPWLCLPPQAKEQCVQLQNLQATPRCHTQPSRKISFLWNWGEIGDSLSQFLAQLQADPAVDWLPGRSAAVYCIESCTKNYTLHCTLHWIVHCIVHSTLHCALKTFLQCAVDCTAQRTTGHPALSYYGFIDDCITGLTSPIPFPNFYFIDDSIRDFTSSSHCCHFTNKCIQWIYGWLFHGFNISNSFPDFLFQPFNAAIIANMPPTSLLPDLMSWLKIVLLTSSTNNTKN